MNPDAWSVFAIAGVALAVIVWAWWPRDDYRSRNDRRAARRLFEDDPPNRETQPGSNNADLLTCRHILATTNNARKEES